MSDEERPMTLDQACSVVQRFGPENGWTDTEEYIRDPKNFGFRLLGRWFMKRDDGKVVSLE